MPITLQTGVMNYKYGGTFKSISCLKGDPGDPTELIDDNSTALDKVWSANKTSGLINQKQDTPSVEGVAGQVLSLDANLNPVWVNQSGGDVSNKADKADTVLDTTLSRGRKAMTSVATGSFAFGNEVEASGNYSHGEGSYTKSTGNSSHAEGSTSYASADFSHAEGYITNAFNNAAHAEGYQTTASGRYSHTEGSGTTASAEASHAEGAGTTANENYAHAEGNTTLAHGRSSHAEGSSTQTNAEAAHAEGSGTNASGTYSHAEGAGSVASGSSSHAEGNTTTASGGQSHAEGSVTVASGGASHAEGYHTIANHAHQHVFGAYNVADPSSASATVHGNYVEIVGNGTAENDRSNARTLDWSGNEVLIGDLTIYSGTVNQVSVSALKNEISNKMDEPVTEGTSGQVLTTDGNGGRSWQTSVQDVQINGTSILSQGVANVPYATITDVGVVKLGDGLQKSSLNNGTIMTKPATSAQIKAGVKPYEPIVPSIQHESTFYGLAKAAGADMASSSNPVGTYTPEAKNAIQNMFGVEPGVVFVEEITGRTPSITGTANTRYICGEVDEITITPPQSGTIDVRFTSASSTVVVIPNTVKFPSWVDLTSVESNTIYEIIITDGVYGGVMTWPV